MSKTYTPKKLERLLARKGFVLDRAKGSHRIYFNHRTRQRVVIPFHAKDLPKGTAYAILKQAGLAIPFFKNHKTADTD